MKMRACKFAIAAALTGTMCGCINFQSILRSAVDHLVWDGFLGPLVLPALGG